LRPPPKAPISAPASTATHTVIKLSSPFT
jgi:hypothetical protein